MRSAPYFCGLAALFSILVLGCHPSPSRSRVLIFGRPSDSVDFDLARASEGESMNVGCNFYEGLVAFHSGTTRIEPKLATSWEISKDGLKYTFHLRKGVLFQDGTPFNADAVIFNFERQWKKDHRAYAYSAPYSYWENMDMDSLLKSVTKKDDFAVAIELKHPSSPFLTNLVMPFMMIPSPTAILKFQRSFNQNPVGTGPYRLKSWKKDDSMELESFPKYWGEKPLIDRVVVRVIPDNQVRLLELEKGNIDIMDYPNPSDIKALQSNPQVKLLYSSGLDLGYLSFNLKKPPLDRLEIRQAIALSIDRRRIVNELFQGFGMLARTMLPPQMLGYDRDVPEIEYNPEKAKAILSRLKLSKKLSFDLWAMPVARPYNPNARKMAEFIQADLDRVGIQTRIVSYDWGTYLDKIGKGEHDLVLIGWSSDNADPDNFLFNLWSKDSAQKIPTQNYSF
jgi:ABC-type transport system substrate-binding protein